MFLKVNQVVFGLQTAVLGASPNRMGVWTQGCSLPKCPSCSSTHTWPSDGGKTIPVESLVRLARAQALPPSGLTLSGGEPTDQSEAVETLVQQFRAVFSGEVILYTGLRWPVFAARFPALLACLDVVVAGPYVRGREPTPLAGSSNQEVQLLTPLGQDLYRDWRSWPLHAVQVGVAGSRQLVTVGIPNIPRLARAAEQVGAEQVTWELDKRKST